MLPPWIIERLRERERPCQHEQIQPQLEVPLPVRRPKHDVDSDERDRGLEIIQLW